MIASSSRHRVGIPECPRFSPFGIDEFFTRTDGVGSRALLTNALGSSVALGDGTGTVQTQYTYEPFGYVSQTGAANTNSYKYTGREDDGSGLYYYRARYYHPRLQRFLIEDPLDFGGGDTNLYAYVANNPLRWIDPSGLDATVTLYPGASRFGHVGIGVNSQSTTGFYPAPNASTWDVVTGQPVPGVMQPDTLTPSATITIPTTAAQDKAIQDYINSRIVNPGNYDLKDRNCTTTVRDALGAGGINAPATIYPKALMRHLQRQFRGRQ